ncbi:MAG: MFS transporter [Polyangiales bacterium]
MSRPAQRVLFGLITAQVCLHASMAGLRMAAPLRILREGGAEVALGPIVALFALAPVALALPAGRLADKRGYHLPLRLAVLLTTVGALLAVLSTLHARAHFPALCLAAMLSGAGANLGMITIQRSAGRASHDPAALRSMFSWLGIAPSLSNVVGPLLAGVLIDRAGFRVAFAFLAVLPLASLACARLVPREPPAAADVRRSRKAAWQLLTAPMLRKLLLVNWFMSASWDVHSFVVPILGDQRGLSASAIGAVLGTFAFAVTAVRLMIPLLAHRLGEAQVLTCAMAVVASVFVVYPWASSVWTMSACASVLGLALGVSNPMVMATLHQITPAHRHGQAIALRSMALNFSSAVMPLGFGVLGTALGANGLFWIMGALVGTGALVARSLDPTAQPAISSPPEA